MGRVKNCFRPTFAKDSRRQEWNTKDGMFWQTYESASYAYLTNAPTKDRILPIFVLRRELKEVFSVENWRLKFEASSSHSAGFFKVVVL